MADRTAVLASATQEVQRRSMGRADTLSASFSRAFAPVINLVFPPRCPLCGVAIAAQSGLCGNCWVKLVIPGEPACCVCSRPFSHEVTGESVQCAACLADPPRHAGIAAATLYNDASRRLVLAFKHGRRIALAGQLGRLMAMKLPDPAGELPLIVPVPLHRWRLWKRGFNQAALLASELARQGKGELVVDMLIRHKATPMLGGKRRSSRQKVVAGAIAVSQRHLAKVKGRKIILVDDVLTSGATTNVCTSELLRAGADSVTISCFARVMNEVLHGERSSDMRLAHIENTTPEAT